MFLLPETHLPQNLGPNSQNGNDGGNDADSRARARSSTNAAYRWLFGDRYRLVQCFPCLLYTSDAADE